MCGIAGEVSVGGTPIQRNWTSIASGRLTHRGPDDAGVWESPDHTVALSHRRLSIIIQVISTLAIMLRLFVTCFIGSRLLSLIPPNRSFRLMSTP